MNKTDTDCTEEGQMRIAPGFSLGNANCPFRPPRLAAALPGGGEAGSGWSLVYRVPTDKSVGYWRMPLPGRHTND